MANHFSTFKKVLAVLVVTGLPIASQALQITLYWDANIESDLAGYNLYQSPTSLLGLTPAQALAKPEVKKTVIADAGATSLTVSGLDYNTGYYFRLTAFNTTNQESTFNVNDADQPDELFYYLSEQEPTQIPLKVYPNPSRYKVNFQFEPQAANVEIRIYNFTGSLVSKIAQSIDVNQSLVEWNAASFPPGPYLYIVYVNGKKSKTGKVALTN